MGSWLLKLLSRNMKTKTKDKDEPTNNHKKIKQKNKSNEMYNTYHEPLFQKWIDGRYRFLRLNFHLPKKLVLFA